jgi:hypothetical protein
LNEGSSQDVFPRRILSEIIPNERSFQDAFQMRDSLKVLSEGSPRYGYFVKHLLNLISHEGSSFKVAFDPCLKFPWK